jgi:hypothetical protein
MHEHYEGFYSEALREDLASDTRTPPPCFKVLGTVLYEPARNRMHVPWCLFSFSFLFLFSVIL